MVDPNGFVETGQQALELLPADVAGLVVFLVQAIGGLLIVYLIFLGVRLYMQRKQTKMIKEMRDDILLIKKKLNIKNKN